MARLSEVNKDRVQNIQQSAEKAKGRRTSNLPQDAPTGVSDITEVDDINSVEQLQAFVKYHASLVLQMIQSLRQDADQIPRLGTDLEYLLEVKASHEETIEIQTGVIDDLNTKFDELKKKNRLLVNQAAERHIESRESTPEGGAEGRKNRTKWPDAQKLKGDDDPSFTMWLQQIMTKCNKDFPDDADRMDYAISRTAGRVSAYIEPFLADGMPILDFDGLIQLLRDYLEDPDPESTARQLLDSLQQKNSQKFSEFLGEWSAPAARLKMSDSEKMYKIKAAICKPLRIKLDNIIDPPADFVGFCRALVKLDNNMRATWAINDTEKKPAARKPSTFQTAGQRAAAANTNFSRGSSASASTFGKNRRSDEEIEKLKKEGKCFVCKEPGHIASEHKKGGPRYEKKTTEVKVNNARIEEISSSSEDSESGKD